MYLPRSRGRARRPEHSSGTPRPEPSPVQQNGQFVIPESTPPSVRVRGSESVKNTEVYQVCGSEGPSPVQQSGLISGVIPEPTPLVYRSEGSPQNFQHGLFYHVIPEPTPPSMVVHGSEGSPHTQQNVQPGQFSDIIPDPAPPSIVPKQNVVASSAMDGSGQIAEVYSLKGHKGM